MLNVGTNNGELSQEDILMLRISHGDEGAFAELYELWSRRIMAYAYRSLKDVHEAQDVVQETFMQLFKAASSYRPEGKFGAFAFRIAGNLVRGRYRVWRPVDSLSAMMEEENWAQPESLRYEPHLEAAGRIDMEMLMGKLPDRQREALIYVANGVSYADGATALETTPEAFAQLVLRGRRTLRKLLEESGELMFKN